jgi:hypothetical protein
MQAYSDPKRASDPHALPDIETFYMGATEQASDDCTLCHTFDPSEDRFEHSEHVGWYWQACFPGCLPDGEPVGPFETEAEALADAQDGSEE